MPHGLQDFGGGDAAMVARDAVHQHRHALPCQQQHQQRRQVRHIARTVVAWDHYRRVTGILYTGGYRQLLERGFGGVEKWRTEFSAMGKAEGGGSGWVILAYSPRDKRLVNQWAADHTTTLAGGRPVMVLDMYEHAYHMDYGAAAAKYVDVFMEAIRWDNAVKLYDRYSRES